MLTICEPCRLVVVFLCNLPVYPVGLTLLFGSRTVGGGGGLEGRGRGRLELPECPRGSLCMKLAPFLPLWFAQFSSLTPPPHPQKMFLWRFKGTVSRKTFVKKCHEGGQDFRHLTEAACTFKKCSYNAHWKFCTGVKLHSVNNVYLTINVLYVHNMRTGFVFKFSTRFSFQLRKNSQLPNFVDLIPFYKGN